MHEIVFLTELNLIKLFFKVVTRYFQEKTLKSVCFKQGKQEIYIAFFNTLWYMYRRIISAYNMYYLYSNN